MPNRAPRMRTSGWIAIALVLPCAVMAQEASHGPQAASGPQAAFGARAVPAQAASDAQPSEARAQPSEARAQQEHADAQPTHADVPPTRADVPPTRADVPPTRADVPSKRADAPRKGKAMDHLQLDTTDITGNRELPKVMYIVPWKRSDLGDLTGKPLDSLIDQTLQPVDRSVFRRENRYYRAVTGGAAQDTRPSDGPDAGPAVRDER